MSAPRTPRTTNRRAALIVFALALVATGFGVWRERELAQREQVIRWQESYSRLQPQLQPFIFQRFVELHNQARNCLQRPRDYSEAAWKNFLNSVEWRKRYPGMLEIGFADYEEDKCVVKLSDSILSECVFPPKMDLLSDARLRKAVRIASENTSGATAPSFKIATGTNTEWVCMGFMPLVKNELPPQSPLENRTNSVGVVFFILDQQVYFQWAQTQISPLTFDLHLVKPDEEAPQKSLTTRPFTNRGISGVWNFVATMRPVSASVGISQWLVLSGGIALSLFLYFLVASQSRLRNEAEIARAETAILNRDLERRITERTAELKLALSQEKELSRLKGSFVSMVSHEIRTPLALILGSAEMLSAYLDRLPSEKRQRHLETIEDAVKRMALLVDDVLLFSRAEAGRLEFKPAAVDINSLCGRIVDEVNSATSRRCPIHAALPAANGPVHVDDALVRHILTNLLTNAVKYSERGSAVSLAAQQLPGRIIFCVRDHGIGIPAVDLKNIFTPFFRSENVASVSGTGLGLVIVKLCAERHGGTIEIESREGEGTAVTVQLPVCEPGQTEMFLNQIKSRPTDA